MNYSPKGYFVWDAWYLEIEGIVHVFHLQKSEAWLSPRGI